MSSSSSSYNSSWITRRYIQDHLKKFYNDPSIVVNSVSVKSASGAGDGYGGVILRVYVNTTSRVKVAPSFIVKTQVWDELTTNTQKKYNIVQKELELYENVLPRIKKLLIGIGETSDVFPDTIGVDWNLEAMIIEDLQVKNYVMVDRTRGLDHQHLLLFIERLASVHAASTVLHQLDPKAYKMCPVGMFNRVIDAYHVFFYNFWDSMCDEISRWQGYSYYAEKLKRIRSHLVESACRVYDNDVEDFCVLTHGDMWINNVMFKYGPNGEPQDAVIVRISKLK